MRHTAPSKVNVAVLVANQLVPLLIKGCVVPVPKYIFLAPIEDTLSVGAAAEFAYVIASSTFAPLHTTQPVIVAVFAAVASAVVQAPYQVLGSPITWN